ncbi:MAG: Crp/Fnr family transcriptional regulator [Exilibacterium sp.]
MDKESFNFNWITALPEAARQAVLGTMRETKLRSGDTVYRLGDSADALYQVIEGQVRIASVSSDGREILMFAMRPGDCFGELGLIEGTRRINSARAQGATRLRILGKTDFQSLRAEYPSINEQLLLMECRRMRLTFDMIEGALQNLRQKMLLRLYMLATAYGEPRGSECIIATRFSQQELGNMVGASRQSVNRELQQLQEEKLIRLESGLIYICDIKTLESLAFS